MNFGRALLFGAGGAAAYTQKDTIVEAIQKSGIASDLKTPQSSSDNNKELEELRRAIMDQKNQKVTVIHSGGKGGPPLILYPTAALALYLVYLRVVKGYKLSDLMYVSKAALQQSVGQVKGGIEKLKEQMDNAKKFLQKQMDQLSDLQRQLMNAQDNMGIQLQGVDNAVGETKAGVDQVSGAVRVLDDRMVTVAKSQQYTERGVYLLCRVVQDIMRINGTPSKSSNALTDFLSASPPLRIEEGGQQQQLQDGSNNSSGIQGLGGIEQISNSPSSRTSFNARTTEQSSKQQQ